MPEDVNRCLGRFFKTIEDTNEAILYHPSLLGFSPCVQHSEPGRACMLSCHGLTAQKKELGLNCLQAIITKIMACHRLAQTLKIYSNI